MKPIIRNIAKSKNKLPNYIIVTVMNDKLYHFLTIHRNNVDKYNGCDLGIWNIKYKEK